MGIVVEILVILENLKVNIYRVYKFIVFCEIVKWKNCNLDKLIDRIFQSKKPTEFSINLIYC